MCLKIRRKGYNWAKPTLTSVPHARHFVLIDHNSRIAGYRVWSSNLSPILSSSASKIPQLMSAGNTGSDTGRYWCLHEESLSTCQGPRQHGQRQTGTCENVIFAARTFTAHQQQLVIIPLEASRGVLFLRSNKSPSTLIRLQICNLHAFFRTCMDML